MPDEGVGSVEGDGRRSGRGESLQSLRDALENAAEVEAGGAIHLCSKEPAAKVCFGGESYFAGNRGSSARTARRALPPQRCNSRRRRSCPPVLPIGSDRQHGGEGKGG